MSEISWVKITVDMFDNRKIKQIRGLPEGNNIVLVWIMLLTIAGRCNAGGMIFLTENIAYTAESLARELDFEVPFIKMAIETLSRFGMIRADTTEFSIVNWEEYQNIEGMERVKEQNRLRKQREREKKRRRTLARLEEIVKEYQIERIVVGLPKNMNNTLGERALKAQEFADMLARRTMLPVICWDERMTTMQAERVLMEAEVRRENRKQYLDEMAAALILQSYMDAEKME